MANPRRTASIWASVAAIESAAGPPIPWYAIPLDRPVLYRWVVGDASAVDHRLVLGANGGTAGRWLQVGQYPRALSATSTSVAGVTITLPFSDNEAWTFAGEIVGRCTVGADAGAVWACSLVTTAKRGVGVGTIVAVGANTIVYRRSAGGYSALTLTVTPNVVTGNLDLVLPGVGAPPAGETMTFSLTLLATKA